MAPRVSSLTVGDFMLLDERSGGVGKRSNLPEARESSVLHEATIPPRSGLAPFSLLSRARNGNPQSVGELLTLYRNYLTLLASTQLERRLQPRVSPSDIVQETMLKAHCHFAQFKGQTEREFLAWLRQILLSSLAHFVERHLLAAKRNIRREISIEECAATPSGSFLIRHALDDAACETPSAEIRQREASTILSARLAQLAPRYREVLVLRNVEGLSFDEVAGRLHRTPAAARMLWLRAIQKLRAIYRRAEEHDA
jgi:RNA polymerase sigma-70 factor (ECF subfamily)